MLVDSHCHLDAPEFEADREAVLDRALAAGVAVQILPAIDAAGWPTLRALSARHPGLLPAYGLHPMFLDRHHPSHLDLLAEWLGREKPVAVGECGLDYFIAGLDRDLQQHYFTRQLELARDFGLPVIVHARRALQDVIGAIRRVGGLSGVVHSFSGSAEQARQLWDLGFLIGVGGPVTYARARRLRRIVAEAPVETLLLETDSPDQPDAAWRGRRNEPARLTEVLHVVAALRGESEAALAAATSANAERLFLQHGRTDRLPGRA